MNKIHLALYSVYMCFIVWWIKVLFFFTGNSFGDTIQPWFPEKHGSEDENVTLSCNYSLTSGTSVTIQWYRQYPEAKPEFLLLVNEYSSKSEPKLRLYSEAKKEIKRVDLVISSAAVSDSAVYYCVLQPTVTGNTSALYQNLLQWEMREKQRQRWIQREISCNYFILLV